MALFLTALAVSCWPFCFLYALAAAAVILLGNQPSCFAAQICSNFVARVQPAAGMNPSFWRYCHAAAYAVRLNTRSIKQTSGIQNLDQSQYLDERAAFPPLAEQTAIAAFLDRETAKIDALVAEQRLLIELLAEKRQAVISHAVTKGLDPHAKLKPSGIEWLGDVPEHWEVKRIKHVVTSEDGIQMGPFGGMLLDLSESDTGFKVYGQENTISGDFNLGQRWIPQNRYLDLMNYHLRAGDLVVTRKGSLGNARLIASIPQPGVIDSDTIRIRVDALKLSPELLTLLLHSADYMAVQIALTKRGAILSGINTETIANLSLALPPRDEQEAVLAAISQTNKEFDALTTEADRAIELLQERRTALISAAVTGKIDVR